MNRAPLISLISVFVLGLALSVPLILGAQRLLGHPVSYDSVYMMGQRVGKVLPQGVNTRSNFAHNQAVSIEPVSHAPQPTPPASRRATTAADRAALSPSPSVIATVIITLSIALSIGFLLRSSSHHGSTREPASSGIRRTIVALAAGIVGGMIVGLAFAGSRVFWTGVNQSFYERSLVVNPDSKSIHVRGDLLLSMSSVELTLMLIGVVLIVVPLTLAIASRVYRVPLLGLLEHSPIQRNGSRAMRILAHPSVAKRFSARSVSVILCVCYVLLTLALWTAPWSTTMARAIWY